MDNTKFWILFIVIMVVMVVGTQLYKRYLLKRFMSTLKIVSLMHFLRLLMGLPANISFLISIVYI